MEDHIQPADPAAIHYPTPLQAFKVTLLLILLNFIALAFTLGIVKILDMENTDLGGLLVYLICVVIMVPVLLNASRFPDQPWTITLAAKPLPGKVLVKWLLIWFVTMLCVVLIQQLLLNVANEPFMEQMLTTDHRFLMIITALSAPFLEELYFRGFLFSSLRHTRLGFSGTLLITSVLFTAIHASQYSSGGLTQIFVLALLLGIAREKSGSLLAPVAIHLTQNSIPVIALLLR